MSHSSCRRGVSIAHRGDKFATVRDFQHLGYASQWPTSEGAQKYFWGPNGTASQWP